MDSNRTNRDDAVIDGFGDEWQRFDQSNLSAEEHRKLFDAYFGIFPWNELPDRAEGFDLGCGSGRWAKLAAPRVGRLHCIDPSSALEVARRNLSGNSNCEFHRADSDSIPVADASMDFGYSLGVLHHIPDTRGAMAACVDKLKPGAPFLVYLYYAFDNRPWWYRGVWKMSEAVRFGISRLPHSIRYFVTQVIAATIYFPLARGAYWLDKAGLDISNMPLSGYSACSFYTMRTDALDRFGTQLEQRFTRAQIKAMMESVGLERIEFSDQAPYWCAVGRRRMAD